MHAIPEIGPSSDSGLRFRYFRTCQAKFCLKRHDPSIPKPHMWSWKSTGKITTKLSCLERIGLQPASRCEDIMICSRYLNPNLHGYYAAMLGKSPKRMNMLCASNVPRFFGYTSNTEISLTTKPTKQFDLFKFQHISCVMAIKSTDIFLAQITKST